MILMYHKVAPECPTMWWVTADSFRRQMLDLRDREVVYLDDYNPDNANQVVITFDGVYDNVLTFAAPTLAALGYPFELFVTGDYIGRDNAFDAVEPPATFASREDLSRLGKLGGRLQWHGNAHLNLGEVRHKRDIDGELSIPEHIRSLDPRGFRWFAYPHGAFTEDVLAAVRTRFRGGLSCHQGNDSNIYCLNRITATEGSNFRRATVSVVIPCYNYGHFLYEAVDSVLNQSLPADEILISDDASTDNTPLVMDMLQRRHGDRLRLHRNGSNLGINEHFNRALGMTRGDFVCFVGADNRLRSDFLEHTVGALNRNPEAAIAYTDFALFGPRSEIIAKELRAAFPVRSVADYFHIVKFPSFNPESRRLLLGDRNFIHGSSLFRRQAFRDVGGYRHSELPEDWDLFRRMVASGWSAIHCNQPLLEYRQHSREQANIRSNSEAELRHYEQYCAELHQEVVRIKSSVSWKITSPLRVAWNLLRKIARRVHALL